mgnify:CR=1 FL=1
MRVGAAFSRDFLFSQIATQSARHREPLRRAGQWTPVRLWRIRGIFETASSCYQMSAD